MEVDDGDRIQQDDHMNDGTTTVEGRLARSTTSTRRQLEHHETDPFFEIDDVPIIKDLREISEQDSRAGQIVTKTSQQMVNGSFQDTAMVPFEYTQSGPYQALVPISISSEDYNQGQEFQERGT